MIYNPHNYQKYAIEFIENNPISALLLDMGLGKTSISLMAINNLLFDSFDVHKVLIIGPLRVSRDTWPSEIKKWDNLSMLKYVIAIGTEDERIKALKSEADIYIINRENVQWLIEKSNLKFDFDMVVIDELSSFKNYQAKRFKSLLKVRPYIKRIVGLTGTPASNGLMDLWAEFRVLDFGKRVGRFITNYRNTYFVPDKRNGQVIFSYKPLPFAEETIYNKISDITISMKASDHLKMPKLINSEYKVYLSDDEKKAYKSLKDDMVLDLKDEEITVSNAAVLSNKLSQMANGCIYSDDGKVIHLHDRKLDALEDMLESANGKPVLIAYWYKHDLEQINKRLKSIGVVYSKLDTEKSIRDWNNKQLQAGLIHPASAGHGLNLQSGGSTLIWYGITWSLELYQQTNARLYRQGQESSTVVINHIICDGTIDEDIIKALINKDKTQDDLINAVKANIGGD